ncbi:hypothetical protein L211DRAFT_895413 [Terfezia boudieri ATCC MYA-4762]|uniref:Uncharacterized protein n=1 Tax=Terfezia boudieri ATCC MYA-4762 TaxID=1051890 RepID=A0A3N4LAV6_9PEZI|nr:hypothetical protein L211DRAFT_895413 [Terfezia boudieri ATCC MYA-4762]
MPDKGKRKDNPGKEDRVNQPHKTRIPVIDHPQPPSPGIPPVIPSDTDLDTRILDTETFNAAMNVLPRAFNPILQTKAAEISTRHSYHLHGLLTILEDFYKINLFSNYYQDDADNHF